MPARPVIAVNVLASAVVAAAVATPAYGAIINRGILKSYYETGDVPTEQQFANLIDSFLSAQLFYGDTIDQHAIRLDNGRFVVDAQGLLQKLDFGARVDDASGFGEIGDEVAFNPLATGNPGAAGVSFNLNGATHFGFIQYQQDGPGSATPYAIHLDYFVYDDTPGAPVTTFFQAVPEPASFALLAFATPLALARRRR